MGVPSTVPTSRAKSQAVVIVSSKMGSHNPSHRGPQQQLGNQACATAVLGNPTERVTKNSGPLSADSVSEDTAHHRTTLASGSGSDSATTPDDDFEWSFDVYAPPFVPEWLRRVNDLDGAVYLTAPSKTIDFGAFVTENLIPNLLPPVPTPLIPSLDKAPSLTPKQYEAHFRFHLESEIEFQEKENASHSIYAHTVEVEFSEAGTARCLILVPGLRENSPYVEEDDVVELRQLRASFPPGSSPYLQYRGASGSFLPQEWTGTIFSGRVDAIVRSREILVVRVDGLTPLTALPVPVVHPPSRLYVKFNIRFPVPRERYLHLEHALSQIQLALRAAGTSTSNASKEEGTGRSFKDLHGNQYWIQSMLFPTEADCDVQTSLNTGFFNLHFFDDVLNWEQRRAVDNVCSQNYGVLPYLVSGPPGTGKTKTLIEMALQLVHRGDKISHILMCAPSEPASDTLAERLQAHLNPQELLRLNRPSRTFSEVPDALLPYCCISNDVFALPPLAELMKYKVVVTSCRDASMLMYSRLTNSDLYATEYGFRSMVHPFSKGPSVAQLHWSALLIDEAAQAMEPEALVPLFIVAPPLVAADLEVTPLVIMAGDQYQLGPRTSAPATPLKRSLFARLFSRAVYAKHPLARGKTGELPPPLSKSMLPILRPPFTNLIRNYRSHPAILAVPSSLFYHDTLEAEASDTDRLASWDGWRGRGWPVLFHNNMSRDDLERDSGGWYNGGEAELACQYAQRLVASGLVAEEEVCIMSPFKAQVGRLRTTIRGANYSLWGVNVGPTEAFQGLEHGVVILCVTRSRRRFVKRDQSLDWGIIRMPNKMNVALTRAKFGLIIIGSREILQEDPNWRAVLDFCDRNGLVVEEEDKASAMEGERAGEQRFDSALPHSENGGYNAGQLTRIEKMLLAKEEATVLMEHPVLGAHTGYHDHL
ncbi:hypothetical protein VTK73DRAFT_2506 [Phialemonium thermophilum]|uniref:RNA helicase n=1 Tax=Phialemonium thermophilum TaxID=223376 RepID=A0ABR3X4E0_9PEZI